MCKKENMSILNMDNVTKVLYYKEDEEKFNKIKCKPIYADYGDYRF